MGAVAWVVAWHSTSQSGGLPDQFAEDTTLVEVFCASHECLPLVHALRHVLSHNILLHAHRVAIIEPLYHLFRRIVPQRRTGTCACVRLGHTPGRPRAALVMWVVCTGLARARSRVANELCMLCIGIGCAKGIALLPPVTDAHVFEHSRACWAYILVRTKLNTLYASAVGRNRRATPPARLPQCLRPSRQR